VTIVWLDDTFKNQWLEVTVRATGNTGIGREDVFYFGNAVGESGNSATDAFVDEADFAGARENAHTFLDRAATNDAYDYNRDCFVDGTDVAIARDHNTDARDPDMEMSDVATVAGRWTAGIPRSGERSYG
jgi:hypothetical protein